MKSTSSRNWKEQLKWSPSLVPMCAHYLLLTFSLFLPGRGSQLGPFVLFWWVTLSLGKFLMFISGFPDLSLLQTPKGWRTASQPVIHASCEAGSALEMFFYLSQYSHGNLHLQIPAQWIAVTGSSLCKDFVVQLVDWSQAQAETETTGPWTPSVTNEQMPWSCSWCTHPIKASRRS